MKTLLALVLCTSAFACTAPTNLAATAKGPTQINLTWTAASVPCYGYIVEVVSPTSTRAIQGMSELQPIPTAGGFACNPAILIPAVTGSNCTYDDTAKAHVYNPSANYLKPWVTEAQYIDPTDGTAAQFPVGRLKNNTQYSFRVKTCTGQTATTCSSGYSNVATTTTANYAVRYVSPSGTNDGSHGTTTGSGAWQTLLYGSQQLACGQILIVQAGSYPATDRIALNPSPTCTASNRAVIQWNIGDTIDFAMDGSRVAVSLGDAGASGGGDYLVLDGVSGRFTGSWDTNGSKPFEIWSQHTALLGISFGPDASNVPSAAYGVYIHGPYWLLASSYIHHVGSPEEHQVNLGSSGFPTYLSNHGVMVNNHITGGSHDTSTCKTENGGSVYGICQYNLIANNVLDGGWGTGVITGTNAPSGGELVEGNFVLHPGYYITFHQDSGATKACFQNGAPGTTIRRNICVVSGYTVRLVEFTSSCSKGLDPVCGMENNLLYSNVIDSPDGNAGRALYGAATNAVPSDFAGTTIADNIIQNIHCDNVNHVYSTEMYYPVGLITHNSITMAGGNAGCFGAKVVTWNNNNTDSLCPECGNPQKIEFFEGRYPAQWIGNDALSGTAEAFVNAAAFDFHLAPGSPLAGAGVHVTDSNYTNPSTATAPDLGVFGLVPPVATTGGGASVSSATRISSRTSH
jgi:hypothetical protein